MSIEIEIWRPVPDFDGLYEVSNEGRIRSLDRIVTNMSYTRKMRGKLMTQWKDTKGCYHVTLSKDGVKYMPFVHRLVALAFIPNPEQKEQVYHLDGDRSNNHVTNLTWGTNSENTQHAYDTRLNLRGQRLITFAGKTQNMSHWARELGITRSQLSYRLKAGWSIARALQR